MNVNRFDNTRQHQQKLDIFIGRISRVKQIHAVVCSQRPVIVFPGAVHAFKGFFMEQAGQSVTPRHLFHSLHHKLVMVNRNIGGLINCRQLVLRRRDLVMLGLGGYSQLPEFYVQILHICAHALSDGSEIMVFHLLPLRRRRSEQRPARINIFPGLPENTPAPDPRWAPPFRPERPYCQTASQCGPPAG